MLSNTNERLVYLTYTQSRTWAMLRLFLPLVLLVPATAASAVTSGDPPIRVSLNSDAYRPGETAQVHVRTQNDGYLLVLRTDVDGWVRVLFPVDPSYDAFIR